MIVARKDKPSSVGVIPRSEEGEDEALPVYERASGSYLAVPGAGSGGSKTSPPKSADSPTNVIVARIEWPSSIVPRSEDLGEYEAEAEAVPVYERASGSYPAVPGAGSGGCKTSPKSAVSPTNVIVTRKERPSSVGVIPRSEEDADEFEAVPIEERAVVKGDGNGKASSAPPSAPSPVHVVTREERREVWL